MYKSLKAKLSTSQSSKTSCLVLTSNMSLQVLPLRVLVARQVIRERMDYKEHLTGKTKSNMDILDRLAGRFLVHTSKLTVERILGGEELSAEEWKGMRRKMSSMLMSSMSRSMLINFLDGTAELSIVESSSSRSGGRKWVVSDVDNVRKGFVLKSGVRMLGPNHWIYYDDFIEDGKLVTAKKMFVKATLDHWHFDMDYQDSFGIDKQGNLDRKFICSLPKSGIKITKVMSALRVSPRHQSEPISISRGTSSGPPSPNPRGSSPRPGGSGALPHCFSVLKL